MALYSERFETPAGDLLDFSVITTPQGQSDLMTLTIFKTPTGCARRRKVFGCTLSQAEWERFITWTGLIEGFCR